MKVGYWAVVVAREGVAADDAAAGDGGVGWVGGASTPTARLEVEAPAALVATLSIVCSPGSLLFILIVIEGTAAPSKKRWMPRFCFACGGPVMVAPRSLYESPA